MTFQALYRLEHRGELDCRIIGVAIDEWDDASLRQHAKDAIEATAEGAVDQNALERVLARLSYIQGDYAKAETFETLKSALGDADDVVYYLEIPPSLFGTVVRGLGAAGLTEGARIVVEKPFGHDLASARRLERGAPRGDRRVAAPAHRPLPRQGAGDGHHLPPLRQLDPRAGLEPQLRGLGADHDGRGLRRRGPGLVLRRGRHAARRRPEPPAPGARPGRDGAALRGPERPRRDPRPQGRPLQGDARRRSRPLRPRPVQRLSRHPRRRRRPRPPRPTSRSSSRSTTGAGTGSPSSSAPASRYRSR